LTLIPVEKPVLPVPLTTVENPEYLSKYAETKRKIQGVFILLKT
jgi:hypothetical protein